MSRCPEDYLGHILLETSFILSSSQGLRKNMFLSDEKLKRAFVRSLEIIGEASKYLPDDFRQKHPQIPWKKMAQMRDKLIHQYFGVDYDVVWDVVVNQIPVLHSEIKKIVNHG